MGLYNPSLTKSLLKTQSFDSDVVYYFYRLLISKKGTLYVKQRAGHLSYVEDPKVNSLFQIYENLEIF